jgi:hypothetical protein
MKYINLNPLIRSAAVYECINRTDECVGYDSRVLYVITGDVSPYGQTQLESYIADTLGIAKENQIWK